MVIALFGEPPHTPGPGNFYPPKTPGIISAPQRHGCASAGAEVSGAHPGEIHFRQRVSIDHEESTNSGEALNCQSQPAAGSEGLVFDRIADIKAQVFAVLRPLPDLVMPVANA